jgi:hypothetical protein
MMNQAHFSPSPSAYPPHNQLFAYTTETTPHETTASTNYDPMDTTSLDDFTQRHKPKKSKRDPIAEYDSELAEAIEFELGLKKHNGLFIYISINIQLTNPNSLNTQYTPIISIPNDNNILSPFKT